MVESVCELLATKFHKKLCEVALHCSRLLGANYPIPRSMGFIFPKSKALMELSSRRTDYIMNIAKALLVGLGRSTKDDHVVAFSMLENSFHRHDLIALDVHCPDMVAQATSWGTLISEAFSVVRNSKYDDNSQHQQVSAAICLCKAILVSESVVTLTKVAQEVVTQSNLSDDLDVAAASAVAAS